MTRFARLFAPGVLFGWLVALPFLAACAYWLVLAQDRYVSEAVISVRKAQQDSPVGGGLAALLSGAGGASHEDVRYLRDYLHSLTLMRKLDASLGLRAHFEAPRQDVLFRLWPQAGQEWMHDYWRQRVTVRLDELSGLLAIRVEGFDPGFAQRVNQSLLRESEAFVNEVSRSIAREQMGFVQGELDRAAQGLRAAREELVRFQATHGVIDPMGQAQAAGALAADLRAQLAKADAELSAKRSYLNDDAAEVVALKGRVAALRLQIERESRQATQPSQGALNRLAITFQAIQAQVAFAEHAYKAALGAVEATRIDTSRKVKSLVVIEPPTLAETAEYPRRLYNLLTVLVACLLLYGGARLAVAAVNEHRD